MPKLLTGRRRQVCELRDACLMLVARHGLASRQSGGVPVTEVVLDRFRIWLTPSGGRRELGVWYAGAAGARVLSLWWSGSGEDVTVVGFRRGAWEQELLALDARGAPPA